MPQLPCRLPWTIHLIACCDLAPMLIIGGLSLAGYFGQSLLERMVFLPVPSLILGLNLWALYRPGRINRWIPIATPLVGFVAIILVFTVVGPWAQRTATSDAYWVLPLILFIASLICTVPTLLGAILLLALPSARRHVFALR